MRGFIPLAKYKQIFYELMDNSGIVDAATIKEMKKQAQYEHCKVRRTLCRVARLAAHDMARIELLVRQQRPHDTASVFNMGYKKSAPIPLMMFHPTDKNSLVVFPNITLNYVCDSPNMLKYVSTFLNFMVHFEDWDKKFKEDLEGDKTKLKWSEKNWRKTLLKRETLTIGKALVRYVYSPGSMSDHIIRDIAEVIRASREPVQLNLCATPEDYLKMYSSDVSSCMAGPEKDDKWAFMRSEGVHPASLYHYMPDVQGVYITRGGRVLARTLIYTISGKRYYGRLFPASGVSEVLLQELAKIGVTQYIPNGKWAGAMAFKVPYHTNKDSGILYFPMPYIDLWNTRLFTRANDAEKCMEFSTGTSASHPSGDGWIQIEHTNQTGYRNVRDFKVMVCDHCRSSHSPSGGVGGYTHQTKGKWVCSTTCVRAMGWIIALRSDGNRVTMDMEEAVPDAFNGEFYTNEHAAMSLGARFLLTDPVFIDENPDLTRSADYTIDLYPSAKSEIDRYAHVICTKLDTGRLPDETRGMGSSGLSTFFQRIRKQSILPVSGSVVDSLTLDQDESHIIINGAIDMSAINRLFADDVDAAESATKVEEKRYGDKGRTVRIVGGDETDIFKLLNRVA
jgi:hypothetical protein